MILITGGSGQLGTELTKLFDEYEIDYLAPSSKELDITNYQTVHEYLTNSNPKFIIHCAAFTNVDAAEDENKSLNYQINANGTKNIAIVSEKIGATVIYISTDYVFDGKTYLEYAVESKTNPINEYGKAKLLGEKYIKLYLNKYYIIRTSWVFGKFGRNFVITMLRLANENNKLTIVNDQYGRPTWTRTIAEFIEYIIHNKIDYGTYNLSNDGSCTWYDFAKEILKDYNSLKIVPVSSDEFPQKATRPKNSVMDLSKVKNSGYKIITWQEALNLMIDDLK